ncbi:MAG: lipoprotein [Thiopseudomonas sp.]|nr:lipoprotein [Thiopseudomonas sp.]
MKRRLLPLIGLMIMLGLTSACGQKGPLYHPDDERTVKERSKDRFEL